MARLPEIVDLSEVAALKPPRSGARWGPWTYYKRGQYLAYKHAYGPGHDYDIPLAQCEDRARAMGWVLHMAGKRWITHTDLGFLVRALRDINGWHSW